VPTPNFNLNFKLQLTSAMTTRLLYLFTRTPLHVGAGSSVGAIDQPIVRERHTGFPIIPGSSIKGVLADLWSADTVNDGKSKISRDLTKDVTWLFGSDSDAAASAGALSIGEARLLAFPIRSAKGSYAWITSPLLLARASRDGVPDLAPLTKELVDKVTDASALFANQKDAPLVLPAANGAPTPRIVLEDYVLTHAGEAPAGLATALTAILPNEPVLADLSNRLVIVSDGMLGFFARTACEVAQHVRIDDATGTADDGGLFNQENVPAETLFYGVVHATKGRSAAHRDRTPAAALDALAKRLTEERSTLQIGGDATTGLGYCTARLA
jgi:CRISPR-associated protein Cmr4